MSDDHSDLEPIDVGAWPPGWYADPWTAGQYRFWNGEAWTGETHRSGPVAAPGASSAPVTSAQVTSAWPSSPSIAAGWGTPISPSYPNPRRGRITAVVAGLVVLVLLAGAVGYAIESHTKSNDSANASPAPTTAPATAPGSGGSPPNAADARALSQVVVRQADVGSARVVLLIPNGNRTSQPTLDLCNGTFATEKLRVARLQVAEADSSGHVLLSTEAVAYRNAAATKSAFAELRKVSAACPHKPVKSPVNEQTAETEFQAPPDRSWPQTRSVERLAYRFVTTAAGTTSPSIAVYLRRGRLLLGLYFPKPNDPQPPVAGKTSIEAIVGLFSARVARLPASVVNGSG